MSNGSELRTWFYAVVAMAAISTVVFVTQHFLIQAFDTTFEILVFYIPTVILTAIYLRLRLPKNKNTEADSLTPIRE